LIKRFINWVRLCLDKKIEKQPESYRKLSDTAIEKPTEAQAAGPGVTPEKKRRRRKKSKWDVSRFEVPPVEGKTRFHDLNLPVPVIHAVADLKFQYCTPVQAEILPKALSGQDAVGQAQTGTGKSAAFLITILTRLHNNPIREKRKPGVPRALILAPTRELVLQIEKDAQSLAKYIGIRPLAVFGGMGYESQKQALKSKIIDMVVATPGRLLDFKKQKLIDLRRVEILIIDEADRMLDMGFIADIRNIVYSTPPKDKRQTMFFSATISPEVENLAGQWTRNSFRVSIEPDTIASESVRQIVYVVTSDEKFSLLYNLIQGHDRVLVFANRREQARELMEKLKRYDVGCDLLSGAVPQQKRLKVLENFKAGKIRVLAATDVAARGIHVEGISLVINYNLPHDPEDYVHRIGRTGRAGSTGTSISFACEHDSFFIPDIEKFLDKKMCCEQPEDDLLKPPPKPVKKPRDAKPGQKQKGYSDKKYQKNRSGRSQNTNSGSRRRRKPNARPAGNNVSRKETTGPGDSNAEAHKPEAGK